MKYSKILVIVVTIAIVLVSITGCKKSADDKNNDDSKLITYKDPPPKPSISIYDAIEWGNDEQVYSHLYHKTATLDGEKNNYPLIFVAVAKGQPPIVRRLLSYGENPNRTCREDMIIVKHLMKYSAGYRHEVSVLHFALQHAEFDIAKILVKNGANPNHLGTYPKRGAEAPLNWSGTHFELTKALIKAGADVNAKDNGGCTPLHNLLTYKFNGSEIEKKEILKVAKLLIESGADVNTKDKEGFTPIKRIDMLIRKSGHQFSELQSLLEKNGGH